MSDAAEMPKYRCHKKVWALKIDGITRLSDGRWSILPAESGYAPFVVPASYIERHTPAVGGYYVVYDDGYKSYSPAKAFEDGYTLIIP